MRIAQMRFRSFRNLGNALAEWGPGLNVLTGANGAGKTNVLEALHIVTGWGAFRGSRFPDTIRWNEKNASLAAEVCGETASSSVIEVAIAARASLRLDGKVCRWSDLRNCVQSLTFLPADMALIEGSPSVRRRFLDVLCALYFPLYAWKLSEYKKVLQHRRYLISRGRPLKVTLIPMARLAAWIWDCRNQVTAVLASDLERWSELQPRPMGLTFKRGGAGTDANALEDFYSATESLAEKERAAGTPLVGPHRDELEICCEGRPALQALSRGQRRRAALSLLLGAAAVIEKRYRTVPVLLLDEVTSELDRAGREILFRTLDDTGWQVFAATAETSLPSFRGHRWHLDGGRIENVQQ